MMGQLARVVNVLKLQNTVTSACYWEHGDCMAHNFRTYKIAFAISVCFFR